MRVTLLVASLLLLLAVSVRAGVQVPNTFLAEVEVKILNHTSSSPVQSFSVSFFPLFLIYFLLLLEVSGHFCTQTGDV